MTMLGRCITKTVLPAIAKDQQFGSRALLEGRVLAQRQHLNITQIFDMGREGETVYLALEFVPGVDLPRVTQHQREQQQSFPLPVAVYVIQQVAEALSIEAFPRAFAEDSSAPMMQALIACDQGEALVRFT